MTDNRQTTRIGGRAGQKSEGGRLRLSPVIAKRLNVPTRTKNSSKEASPTTGGWDLRGSSVWNRLLGIAILAGGILFVYWPSITGGFLLDDDVLLTQNPLIAAPDGLYRFWFTTESPDYWPVTNSSLWLEWRLWRMNSTGYHVTNLFLHWLDSVLIWVLLKRLNIPGAFLAALLFAVHPVNVESVAWIAQRKDLLAMLFGLLSINWYLRADSSETIRAAATRRANRSMLWYGLSLAAFVLAMLSKGSVAVLPLLLLVIVWWQRGRIGQRDLLRTAPFWVVAVVLAAVNVWFQTHGSGQAIRDVTLAQRIAGAGAAIWFYLMKAVAPVQLAFIYPQWNIQTENFIWWLPLLAAIAVTVWLWRQRNGTWGRATLAAWACFVISLLPVLGFTDVGFMRFSLVADHYEHLALVSIVALVAAGIYQFYERRKNAGAILPIAAAVVIVGVLAVLARNQSALYASAETLYLDTLAKNPDCWMAHYNLGVAYNAAGQPKLAIPHFEEALRQHPDYPECEVSLGLAESRLGRTAEAIDHYRRVLEMHPDFAEAHNNLGLALADAGRFDEALEQYQAALKTKSNSADVQNNLGTALAGLGRTDEAILHYQAALRIDPANAQAQNNWGSALAAKGQFGDAIRHYEQALQLKPDFPAALVNLGTSLAATGQIQKAADEFEAALRLEPERLEAAVYLAEAYAQLGRFADAAVVAQRALDLARANGETQMAETISGRLNAFRQQAASREK